MIVFVAAALLAATWLAAPPAMAASCILDNCADQRPTPARAPSNDGRFRQSAPAGDFDYYLLALSWSPSFCANGGAEKSRRQCAPGANPGFVVHGLWPQQRQGYAPPCDGAAALPYSLLAELRDLYPDEGLARHEWRAHGACSGKNPQAYFADVRAARAAVTIPPEFTAPRETQTLSPLDVQRAFVAANPRLRPGMMTVTCQRGALQEARICLSKDLRDFVACPELAQRGCHSQSLSVPAAQ